MLGKSKYRNLLEGILGRIVDHWAILKLSQTLWTSRLRIVKTKVCVQKNSNSQWFDEICEVKILMNCLINKS